MKTKPTALTIALLAAIATPATAQPLEEVNANTQGVATPVAVTFPLTEAQLAGKADNPAPDPGVGNEQPQTPGNTDPKPGSPEQPGMSEKPGASETPSDQASDVKPDIEVKESNGLEKALQDAKAALQDGTKKTYTIKVATTEPQQLPAEINANGKIVIIGMGDEPAGVGGKKDVARTLLVAVPNSDDGTVIKSPVEFRGVTAKALSHDLFKASNALTIANSVFEGGPEGKDDYVVKSDLDDKVKDAVIEVKDSAFSGIGVIEIEDGEGKVTVKKNVITHNPSVDDPTIEVAADLDYPAAGGHPVVIEGNAFTSSAAPANSASVLVSRPDVTVHNNTFTLDKPVDGAAAIHVKNPDPKDGVAVKNVKVTFNKFTGGTAVANHLGTALEPKALELHDNDFSKADKVLPKGKDANDPLGTKTPKEAIDATKNFWGDKKTDEVNADTSNPLNAYTPPKDEKPSDPSNPPSGGGGGGSTPPPSGSPSDPSNPGIAGKRKVNRVAGETRFETAVQIAQQDYKDGAKAVILARGDVHADSVSAVPLAEELDAPVLLSQPDTLHTETAKEIKRLMPSGGKVIFMGGEAALSKAVEDEVTKLGGQVERIAGQNRAGTAVETANRLQKDGKLKELLVADGTDWQADLVAGPAAAQADGAMLLTNGDQMAPETESFLKQHASVKVTAIGSTAIKAGEKPAPTGGPSTTAPSPSEGATGGPAPADPVSTEKPIDSATPEDSAKPDTKPSEVGVQPITKSQRNDEATSFFANAVSTADVAASPSASATPTTSPSTSPSDGSSPSAKPSAPSEGVGFTNKIEGTDATALSLAVAKQYFKDPKTVGVATTEDFADALAGGAQVAEKDGPILLAPKAIPTAVKEYLTGNKTVTQVYVYGGTTRFDDSALQALAD